MTTKHHGSRGRRFAAVLVTVALGTAACGSDDEEGATDSTADSTTDSTTTSGDTASTASGDEAGDVSDSDLLTNDRIGLSDASKEMTVQVNVFWSHTTDIEDWGNGFRQLYLDFARSHPDWKLNLKIVPADQSTQEQARLLEQARVGRAADCASVDSFAIPQFIDEGVLQPMTPYFTDEEINALYPFVRDVIVRDDEVYAYWWNTDLRLIWRNTDLVPEAPTTTAELIEYASAAAQANDNVDGYLYQGGRTEGATFDNLAYFWGLGGNLMSDGQIALGEPANRTAMTTTLEFLKETVESGASPQRVATIDTYDDLVTAAASDSVAMFLGADFTRSALEGTLTPEQFAKWQPSLPPVINDGDTPVTGVGGWAWGAFTEDPEKIEMCAEFVKEVYAGPGNEVTGVLPTKPELFASDSFSDPVFTLYQEQLEFGRARPSNALYPGLSNALQVAIGEVLTGQNDPASAVDDVLDEVSN